MMVATERAPWQNPKIVSTLMLVFLAGAATGALSMRLGVHSRVRQATALSPAQVSQDEILNRFKKQLDLSPPQAEKLALVLDDYRQYYMSLEDQLDDLRATGKTRIMQILNPEQRDKFEKLMNELQPQLERRQ
jgi:hypothetical protein